MSAQAPQPPTHALKCVEDDEERKASTTRLDAFPRYAKEEVAPITSTPKKQVPLDPSYLLPFDTRSDKVIEMSQESLTSGLSCLISRPIKRGYEETSYSTKRYRGQTSEVQCLNSQFIRKGTAEAEYFRCYYDWEVVREPVAADAKLATNIYDDDCDTDDEQINQATALIKRQLQDAIMVAKSNLI